MIKRKKSWIQKCNFQLPVFALTLIFLQLNFSFFPLNKEKTNSWKPRNPLERRSRRKRAVWDVMILQLQIWLGGILQLYTREVVSKFFSSFFPSIHCQPFFFALNLFFFSIFFSSLSVCHQYFYKLIYFFPLFLVACPRLFKPLCRLVGRSVGLSVAVCEAHATYGYLPCLRVGSRPFL